MTALFFVPLATVPRWAHAAPVPKESLSEEELAQKEEEAVLAREKAFDAYVALEAGKENQDKVMVPEQQELLRQELKVLQKELLQFPKKDRFRLNQDTHYTYDSNPDRTRIHGHEKGDSTFKINPSAEVDLGGRKTDLRVEYRWDRIYNVKRPGSDTFNQETTVRFNRKILPKTTLTLNDRLSRSSVRVVGRDNKKIGWDNAHRQTLSYDLNPKISLNLDSNFTRSYFPAEADDETGTLTYSLDPNVAFQLTRKTRFTAGYQWNFTQIPTESSDATTHTFRWGYSGRLTPKSTLSADFSLARANPDSAQVGKTSTVTSSLAYAWQVTPKTSLRALYSNSYAHAVSDSISGTSLRKSTSKTASNTWTLSGQFRLNRRVTADLSFNPSHNHSRTKQTSALNTHTQTIVFPFQVGFDVNLTKWLKLRLTYTYRHQIGDEPKTDENRAHTWFVGMNTAI